MSSTILELSELDGDGKKVNPDFQTGECMVNLKNPTTLNSGDIVNIKAGFLDTVQSGSGKIKITPEEASSFKIDYYLYNQNNVAKGKIFNRVDPDSPLVVVNTPHNDNKSYIISDSTGTPDDPDLVEFFEFTFHRRGGTTFVLQMGGGIVQFEYLDIKGKKAIANVNVPVVDLNVPHPPKTVTVKQTFIGKKGSMILITNATRMREKFKFQANQVDINTRVHTHAEITLTPTLFTYSFTIDPGDYLPTELAAVLTNKLSDINNASSDGDIYAEGFAADNQFIKISTLLPENTSTESNQIPFLVAQDGNSTVQYPTTPKFPNNSGGKFLPGYDANTVAVDPFYIGSSELGLEYDDATNKLFFSQTHSNIYNNTGDIVVTPVESVIQKTGESEKSLYSWGSSSGGVLFKDLQPSSVWFDKMGFDESSILVVENQIPTHSLGSQLSSVTTTEIVNYSPGKTHTEAYVGVDSAVQKNNDYAIAQNFGDLLAGATSVLNRQIYAKDSLNAPIATQGYLLVEVNGLPSKKLISRDDQSSAITAIVSRFYTNEGYTAFQEDQSIAYEHQGAPFKINKLGFRVLDPNHQLSEFVDSDNTVFIEVIKKNPVPLVADNL